MDKANIQYGSLSRQEITLKDLTFGNASDKEISATHQNLQQDDEANHITIHNLKLARVYRPTIRIFSDISALLVALPYGMQMQVINTRLLASGPLGLLYFVFYAFLALKPCDQRDAASSMHVSGTVW